MEDPNIPDEEGQPVTFEEASEQAAISAFFIDDRSVLSDDILEYE